MGAAHEEDRHGRQPEQSSRSVPSVFRQASDKSEFMTTKRVLDVGQCGPDHSSISHFLRQHFDVEIERTHLPADTFAAMQKTTFDLVLVNRKLDADYSDGIEIIRRIISDESLTVPVMLVSNYPESQTQAVEMGATYGFGKAELGRPDVLERVAAILGK